ncbi:MAG: universal stress protein [Rhodospirillales bacterium]|nr:universal stress protein [Rhodospirillales bacterium]
MPDTKNYIDVETSEGKSPGRRGDGGIYLTIASESEEGQRALRYAARMAQINRGHLGIVHVLHVDDFQHWGNVEDIMKQEMRAEAEKFIWAMAKSVQELTGDVPVLYIEEGERNDVLVDIINDDPAIKMLVLGGGTGGAGPGPLVAHFAGKGLSRLCVPVVVVPGHLDSQKIDAIV